MSGTTGIPYHIQLDDRISYRNTIVNHYYPRCPVQNLYWIGCILEMFCVKSNSSIWVCFRQFPPCFLKDGIFRAVLTGRILLNKLGWCADILTNSVRASLMNLDEILLCGSQRHCPQRRYWTSIKCMCSNAPNRLQKLHFSLSSSPFTIIHAGGAGWAGHPHARDPVKQLA